MDYCLGNHFLTKTQYNAVLQEAKAEATQGTLSKADRNQAIAVAKSSWFVVDKPDFDSSTKSDVHTFCQATYTESFPVFLSQTTGAAE